MDSDEQGGQPSDTCEDPQEPAVSSIGISPDQAVKSKKKKRLFCSFCDRAFRLQKALDRHLKTHINERNREASRCNFCQMSFGAKRALDDHLKTHLPYACSECVARFISEKSLLKHYEDNHAGNFVPVREEECQEEPIVVEPNFEEEPDGERSEDLSASVQSRPFLCSMCDKNFTKKEYLTKHIELVTVSLAPPIPDK